MTPDTVVSTETVTAPSGDKVTITRDHWGVPFIDAPNRSDAMYGVGYANAEDRLWLDDVLRHIGRGTITSYLGDAPGLTSFDANLAVTAGYSEQELTDMFNATVEQLGPLGVVVKNDANQFVAGINAYIATLAPGGSGQPSPKTPPEYFTLKPGGYPPALFTVNDIIASAILIQSQFATGGGGEVTNENLLQKLDPGFTAGTTTVPVAACELWRDLRHANDPETPTTIDIRFATQSPTTLDETCPQTLPAGVAVWDVGSLKSRAVLQITALTSQVSLSGIRGLLLSILPGLQPLLPARTVNANGTSSVAPIEVAGLGDALLLTKPEKPRLIHASFNPIQGAKQALRRAGIDMPTSMSNFIAVTADQTTDGHPIAVMGPQTGYDVPQFLWEFAVHSHGGTSLDFDGRGIDFAMLPYIEIGRSKNFAWSATSGESDLVDTRVSKMCNMNGSAPSLALVNGFPSADGYVYDAQDGKGPQCRRFYERTDHWTTTPTPASAALGGASQPESVARYILRTHYGPVTATATVNGQPVAISQQRSTFYNELTTVAPFAVASTGLISGPADFQRVFNGVTGTFNWLYIDSQHLGYIQSGLFPMRDAQQDPDLPVWGNGDYEWASDADAVNGANSSYFAQYGGSVSYPPRVTVVAQGDPTETGTYSFKDYLTEAAHPQIVDPARGYIDSWNNKPAPGWWAADSNGAWGPTQRVVMLADRLKAFQASNQKFNFANMVEIMSDAAYTDLRGQVVLPLLLQLMQQGTLTANQTTVVTLMQGWLDDGSNWILGEKDLGAWRRDRNDDGVYDHRAAVVLMDAWSPHLIDTMLPQMTALGNDSLALQGRYNAPGAGGSAYQSGWFEHMKRVLEMVLNTPGHSDYRALKCAGTGTETDCRTAVLSALTDALTDLGGLSNEANWDGTQLVNPSDGKTGEKVEDYDAVRHTDFSLLSVPPIRWLNRPTFQQVVEIRSSN